MHGWVGRKDRQPVEIEAVVQRTDGTEARARLTNFSEEGCRIEAEEEFLIGERLQIAIPRLGALNAQVRWALPGSAGARFLPDAAC
jgi:hypothetical protein